MKMLVQRVKHAKVTVDGNVTGAIEQGYLVLLGIAPEDTTEIMEKMVDKLLRLRIFSDENDKINLSLQDVGGSFVHAAPPAQAEALYEACKAYCRERVSVVESGIFGADMQVELCNDGPFTVLLDSAEIIKN